MNPLLALIPTGELWFARGATSIAAAEAQGLEEFGNIVEGSWETKVSEVNHEGNYRTGRVIDRVFTTLKEANFMVKLDEISLANLSKWTLGSDPTPYTRSVITAATADSIVFSSGSPSISSRWYPIKKSGVIVRFIDTLSITSLTEGTDYVLDKQRGYIRFLTTQTASVAPTISAAALTTNNAKFNQITPLQTGTITGVAEFALYDPNDSTTAGRLRMIWRCLLYLRPDSKVDFDGKKMSELSFKATVGASFDPILFTE